MAIKNYITPTKKISDYHPDDQEWILERSGILMDSLGLSAEQADIEAIKYFEEYKKTLHQSIKP